MNMHESNVLRRFALLLFALCAGLALCSTAVAGQTRKAAPKPVPQAVELLSSSTADLPAMRQRGQVRVLVTPNRTNFTMAQDGSFRGLEHGLALQLERSLNKGLKKGEGKVRVVFVPVLRDELLPALLEGRGDVAAAGLTITPEREAKVAFSLPYFENVREVLVSRAGAPPVRSLDDLAGRTIHMVASGSYAEHLEPLRQSFAQRGLPALPLIQADHALETENLLEMLSAGLLENVAADEHIARLWAQVLPGLAIQPQAMAQGGRIAWAVRKDNPHLLAAVNKALAGNAKNQAALINANFPGTRKDAQKRLANPFLAPKTASLVPDFQQRSEEYGFDWLHMMAQGFQESGLDNSARSRTGAVGVMQVLPATGASLGFRDIRPASANIHAGVRYMSKMRDEETSGDGLDPEQRFYFALASYNAGPARVRKLREQARSEGLDPDVWFGSVERVALRQGCQGAVVYVRNIRAYYIAYSLSWDIHLRRVKASQDESASNPAQAAQP
ncbi:MAG TPA: transporter substrate-binding domain-containing protein [Humidesulfovibrio sp.]|uniref:transporter substrate-binding domain-containing protein n=1 Tax=Humidesulfovibrio sp. TaxID=2910988 RepID=UPI002CED49AB|nr:transporter substrate-binding domain-containing protein [Humidesulfovibrio sp.]HWR04717.1 transporter substrate-binding domain-containing protein [Humidesulfovibrio sp.]